MSSSGATSPAQRRRLGVWPAVGIGAVAVGLTLAVGELLAAVAGYLALLGGAASPFGSLGAAFIAITPEWLKDLGISLFGQSDKAALAVAMVVTFAIVAALIGLAGRLRVWAAVTLGVGMVAVTGIAILTRPAATVGELIPLLLGAVAGITFLVRVLPPTGDEPDHAAPDHAPPDDAPSDDAAPDAAVPDAAVPDRAPLARRRVLQISGVGALAAAVAGALSRVVPAGVDVRAERAAVTLPAAAGPPDPTSGAGSPSGAGSAAGSSSGSAAGSGASAAAGSGAAPRSTGLPPLPVGVNPAVPELTPYVTPDDRFYRVDTAFTLPRLATDGWRLRVHGQVDAPFEIDWDDLLAMPQVQRWITLACVSNPVGGNLVGNAAWQGVRIADLLARARPRSGADCVLSTSADSFTVTTPLDALTDGRDALLAIGMNGQPLPIEHGFPVRMVVPGLYGYVSATKWVVDLEVTRFADVAAYWTTRGWSARGPIKTSSRIDTPHYGVTVPSPTVSVAGVAWAQHRGISAVQVQVDDGRWRDATLAGTASKDTWRQWVYRWDTTADGPGEHTLRCRAVDGTGAVQIAARAPVAPDGATGYHEVPVVVA